MIHIALKLNASIHVPSPKYPQSPKQPSLDRLHVADPHAETTINDILQLVTPIGHAGESHRATEVFAVLVASREKFWAEREETPRPLAISLAARPQTG